MYGPLTEREFIPAIRRALVSVKSMDSLVPSQWRFEVPPKEFLVAVKRELGHEWSIAPAGGAHLAKLAASTDKAPRPIVFELPKIVNGKYGITIEPGGP